MTNAMDTVRKYGGFWTAIAVVAGLAWFLWIIYSFPNFFKDDYYIFFKISNQPSSLISTNISERFFLFLRPATYLYFWILYMLFGTSAIAMKCVGAALATTMFIFLFGALRKMFVLRGMTFNPGLTAVICLMTALHRDIAYAIIWIADINEIIAALFYVLSFYVILHCEIRTRHIILSCFFYLIAVLAKPQPLHFPLLLIFFFLLHGNRYDDVSKKNIRILIFISGLIFLSIVVTNSIVITSASSEYSLSGQLWKKPFALVGTIFYIFFPTIGEWVYFFFFQNRGLAIALITLLFAVMIIHHRIRTLLIKHYSKISLVVFFVIIIFFPRIFGYGGERLNVTQLVWLPLFMLLLFRNMQNKSRIIITSFFVVQNAISTIALIEDLINEERKILIHSNAVRQYQEQINEPITVVPSVANYWKTPYLVAFQRTNQFGVDSTIRYLEIMADNPYLSDFENRIHVKRFDDLIEVSVDSISGTYLVLYQYSNLIAVKKEEEISRGYRSITIRVPERINANRFVQVIGDSIIER